MVQCSAEKCRADQSRCARECAEELRMRKERFWFNTATNAALYSSFSTSLLGAAASPDPTNGGIRVLGLRVFFTYDQLWWMGGCVGRFSHTSAGSCYFGLFVFLKHLSLSLSLNSLQVASILSSVPGLYY
jgi:hypothetical protein